MEVEEIEGDVTCELFGRGQKVKFRYVLSCPYLYPYLYVLASR